MKNRLYILLAVVFINVLTSLFLFSPAKVSASGTSLAVTPSTLQIQAKPPADIWAPFTIENQSNHSVILQIGYKSLDPQKSQNGTVVFLSNNQSTTGIDKNIFEKMQVVDENNISHDSIALGPEQKKTTPSACSYSSERAAKRLLLFTFIYYKTDKYRSK